MDCGGEGYLLADCAGGEELFWGGEAEGAEQRMRTWNGAWTKGTGARQKAQLPVNVDVHVCFQGSHMFLNSRAAPGVVTPQGPLRAGGGLRGRPGGESS